MKRCLLSMFGLALALLLVPLLAGAGQQPGKKPSLADEIKVGKRYYFVPAGRDYFEHGPFLEVLATDKEWVKVKSFLRHRPEVWINLNQVGAIQTLEEVEGDRRADSDVEAIAAEGEITYNPGQIVRVSARVAGTVWRMEKALGQPVLKDDVLALVSAPEVGKAKAEFLEALTQAELGGKFLDRLRAVGDAVSAQRVLEAEADQRRAQVRILVARQALVNLGLPIQDEDVKGLAGAEFAKRLQFLGLPENLVKELDPKTAPTDLAPLRTPLGGVVSEREVVLGEVVDAVKTLFVVVDTRQMLLDLHVPLAEARHLVAGQAVRFRPDGGSADLEGKIALISTGVDEKTHTITAWVHLANPDGRLRANTPGKGRIIVKEVKK